jgi:hypothetical protein
VTKAHIDGVCGSDASGCARCTELAAMNLPWSDPRRLALSARRNAALGGGYAGIRYPDPDAPREEA